MHMPVKVFTILNTQRSKYFQMSQFYPCFYYDMKKPTYKVFLA